MYKHAARFVGRSPWTVSRNAEMMFEGHRRACLEYRHQTICVGIDNLCHALLDAAEARIPRKVKKLMRPLGDRILEGRRGVRGFGSSRMNCRSGLLLPGTGSRCPYLRFQFIKEN